MQWWVSEIEERLKAARGTEDAPNLDAHTCVSNDDFSTWVIWADVAYSGDDVNATAEVHGANGKELCDFIAHAYNSDIERLVSAVKFLRKRVTEIGNAGMAKYQAHEIEQMVKDTQISLMRGEFGEVR